MRGRCPKPLDECATETKFELSTYKDTLNSSQKFTTQLLEKFIISRPLGTSPRSIEAYHYTLDSFVGYPISPQGITSYLSSLTCSNGKAKFYSCLRALSRWLYHNSYIPENVIDKVSPPKIQKRLLPAISKEQLEVLIKLCHCERDRALINFLWHSGTRLSEAINIKANDFNWGEGTVIVLGKGNRYRKCLAGNGIVREWFGTHDSFEINKGGTQTMLERLKAESGIQCNAHSFRRGFCVHQVTSGLSTRVVQALGGWERITMVEHYSKSLSFDDALELYHKVNGNSAS
ncbi:tyrosine-type recombinase/integrase [Chloroflexota bacterium]